MLLTKFELNFEVLKQRPKPTLTWKSEP